MFRQFRIDLLTVEILTATIRMFGIKESSTHQVRILLNFLHNRIESCVLRKIRKGFAGCTGHFEVRFGVNILKNAVFR